MAVPATIRNAPTIELGAETWSSRFSPPPLDDHEMQADLAWPQSVQQTYPWMLNDAHVEGMARGVLYPIRAYRWWLDPNGARPEVVDRISRAYNLPVGPDGTVHQARSRRRFIFDEHLEDALRAPLLGHAYFELVYDLRQDGPTGVNAGWVAWLRKLAYRPARSIIDIQPAPDGGLDYIKVPELSTGARNSGHTIGTVDIPIDRLVAYVWEREGANWAGRSMLRSCYRPWKLKDRVIRVGAINIERAGGVPYVEAPEGATQQQIADLHRLASMFRVGETAGAALPHGAQLKFASAAGGSEAVEYVKLQNEEMARAWVQMVMVLGQTQTGSRALGETFGERADLVQQAIAQWFCRVFTRHVIEDDVDLNEGKSEELTPILAFTPVGDPVDQLAGALDDAQTAGALPADSPTAAAVKDEYRRGRRRPAAPMAAAAADRPDIEQHVDFDDLQTEWQRAVDELVSDWRDVRAGQITELVAVIAQTSDLAALADLRATPAGADLIADRMIRLLEHGAHQVMLEAGRMGAPNVTMPDLDLLREQMRARAEAVAGLMERSLSEAAARQAIARTTDSSSPADVADQVREYLDALTDQYPQDQFGGAMSQAQATGRRAVMNRNPPERIYASELLDGNTCEVCAALDGKEYATLADAETDYPTGGAADCLGGPRCRGTLVAQWPEAEAA